MQNKKFFKTIIFIVVLCIPLIYSFFYLKSYWDPYGNLTDLKVAIVNLDKGQDDTNQGNELVKELKVEPYVRLVGMKNNPYPYIRKADLYVQPSRFESFGLTIMEAIILGKTVISTNTSGAKEIMLQQKNEIICVDSIEELFCAVKSFISGKHGQRNDNLKQFDAENRIMMDMLEKVL